jgi:hypothetical protein
MASKDFGKVFGNKCDVQIETVLWYPYEDFGIGLDPELREAGDCAMAWKSFAFVTVPPPSSSSSLEMFQN